MPARQSQSADCWRWGGRLHHLGYALVALALEFACPRPAYAVLLSEDRFYTSATPSGIEYALGSLAGQNPNTPGFSGAWFTSNGSSSTVVASSLTYADANFPASAGGSVLSPIGNSRVHRLLAPASNPFETTDSGAVYLSFLLQTGTNNGYRAFEMHNGGNEDAANRTLQIGLSSFTDFPSTSQFGFRVNNNSSFDASLGLEDGNVHLFLVKFNLSTTNNADTITVWNNPNLSNLSSDPAGGVMASGFNFAADRLGAGHFTGTAYGLDELRIGTTLVDAVTNFLSCDLNGNGVCNSTDARVLSDHMYLAGTYADGDIDGSGVVDFADFRLFKDHPSRVVGFDPPGSGASIPEPAGAMLVLLAGLCWLVYSRPILGRSARGFQPPALPGVIRQLDLVIDSTPGRAGGCRRFQLADGLSFLSRVPAPAWHAYNPAKMAGLSLLLIAAVISSAPRARAAEEDLLNDPLEFSGATLNLRPWAQLPAGFNDMISMTYRPDDVRMHVSTQEGTIFVVNENADGTTTSQPFFNVAGAIDQATTRTLFGSTGHDGLQSAAFHPDFGNPAAAGYGKLYTTLMETRPSSTVGHHYLGSSTSGDSQRDSVLLEWTYNHATGQVDPGSYRELFRARLPVADHMIKQARFNTYAEPGDEDYGLLYLTHGDSSSQQSTEDRPQLLDNVYGKMLRIDPLQSGADPYSIPESNPFAGSGDPNVLQEIYAYGMRNPHNFSFNQDDDGLVHILVGDIGRNNVEEVNLVVNGGNYGWTEREGIFVHRQGIIDVDDPLNPPPNPDAGYIYGVTNLPANEATVGVDAQGNRYRFPVAQYDHNGVDIWLGKDFNATAIASGFVIRNGSDPALQNQLIFNNFSFNHGDVYHADFEGMLAAVTQLDPGNPSRDEPGELTQAVVNRLQLTLDHDNDPMTPPVMSDNLNTLLSVFRNDARYGESVSGEMFITNKNNNIVYLVTNTVPDDRLTLTVDRGTGQMTISNSSGTDIAVDRVSLFSPSGSLLPGDFETLGVEWAVTGANTAKALNQTNAMGSLNFDGATTASLGDAYEGQLIAFGEPVGEDVQFVYWTEGPAGRSFAGEVDYTGESTVPNTIVLTVDVTTGEAFMLNQTPFSQEVEGYTLSSSSESLNPAGWNSFEAQGIDDGDWLASPPLAERLTEVQEDGTTTFDELTQYNIGAILETGGEPDLVFEFLLAGEGGLREGLVDYVLPGDYNGDNMVDGADYVVWRKNVDTTARLPNDLTPGSVSTGDYNIWRSHFGEVWPGAGSGVGSLAVPEPAAVVLASIALTFGAVWRRRLGGLER